MALRDDDIEKSTQVDNSNVVKVIEVKDNQSEFCFGFGYLFPVVLLFIILIGGGIGIGFSQLMICKRDTEDRWCN